MENILIFYRSRRIIGTFSVLWEIKGELDFFEVNELVYPRLVRTFFVATEVDSNNFTLKATLKGTEILISEQLLADLLGVPVDNWSVWNNRAKKEEDSKEFFGG